jgi:hypothetical protein
MGVWLRKSSHRIHRSLVASVLPRNSRNSQKFCCVGHPTEFTDLHRWLGCVCSPTEFTEFTEVRLRKSSHRIHRIHRSFIASVLPRNSQNSQKFCCVGPPTEFTEFTEVLLRWFSHRIHGIHRSFIASHSSINLESVLWEVLLCQKVPCVLCVLWAISLLVLLVQFLLWQSATSS